MSEPSPEDEEEITVRTLDDATTSLQPAEKMEVLVGLYEQLDQNHHHHNNVIFQLYYLSVVFFGVIASVLLTGNRSEFVTAGIATFGAFVMFLLWFWAYMYLKARRQIKEHKSNIVNEFKLYDEEFITMDAEEAFFFTHEGTPNRTILSSVLKRVGKEPDGDFLGIEYRKDFAEWAYFLILGLIFICYAIFVLLA